MEKADTKSGSDRAASPKELDAGDLLGALFDAHQQRLYRLALRLCIEHEDAKDLLQETFLRAARTPHAIPTTGNGAEAWLVTIMVNLARDLQRKTAVRRRHPAEEIPSATPRTAPNPETDTVSRSTVVKALSQLDPRRRAIVVLRDLEELPVRRVAELLALRPVTVRWHHAAAMRSLQRALLPSPSIQRGTES